MIIFTYIVFILTGISYIFSLYSVRLAGQGQPDITFVKYYSLSGLIGHILFFISSYFFLNSNPVAHFLTTIQFFIFLYYLINFNINKNCLKILGLISLIIFMYNGIIKRNGLLNIDDVNFTFCNLFYIFLTIKILSYQLKNNEVNFGNTILFSTIFICTSSRFILGIFENEIRESLTSASFFLLISLNIITLFQNIFFSISLWKLKEA